MTQMSKYGVEGMVLMLEYGYALGHRATTTVTGPWELQQWLWICMIHLLQKQASFHDWLQLTAAVLYGCKHQCLEGSLLGISCPFSQTVAVTSPTGPVTSPDTGWLLAYNNREPPPVQLALNPFVKLWITFVAAYHYCKRRHVLHAGVQGPQPSRKVGDSSP